VLAELDMPPEVLLGPAPGEDACALELPGGVLVAASDPVTLTEAEAGRHAVVVNANDVAVTGAQPRWFLATVLLPLGATEEQLRQVVADVRGALEDVGATLVGGHSEVTGAVARPVVVGVMLGTAPSGGVVRTGGVRPGDVVVQVGPAPVEGGAVLARLPEVAGRLEASVRRAALQGLRDPGISVVEAALAAARLGASALHDPTEGGLAAGLHELAAASGLRLRVDRRAVVWFEPALSACRAAGADPWATLASGTLLAAFEPGAVDAALGALEDAGQRAARLGTAVAGEPGVEDLEGNPVPRPERDALDELLEAP
jgi:hydrogenase expression/formation protein HypE